MEKHNPKFSTKETNKNNNNNQTNKQTATTQQQTKLTARNYQHNKNTKIQKHIATIPKMRKYQLYHDITKILNNTKSNTQTQKRNLNTENK